MEGCSPGADAAAGLLSRRGTAAAGGPRVWRFPPSHFVSRFRFLGTAKRRRLRPRLSPAPLALGGMDCPKTLDAEAVAGLPDDLLVEILSRVPAMSICRFKCVSKAWRGLIAHPDYRKKLRQAMQGLFFMTSEADESKMLIRFDFIDLTARPVPLDIDPCFSFLSQVLILLDSCNGLILFSQHQDLDSDNAWSYIVCNPTTKQWGVVPFVGSSTEPWLIRTKLAFDPAVSSHFYLVQFGVEGNLLSLHAYSSETGIWNHNQTEEPEEQGEFEGWHRQFRLNILPEPSMPESVFLNGFLHFMVSCPHVDQIIALDVQGKARRMIKLPALCHRRRWVCCLGQSQGQLLYMAQKLRRGQGGRHRLDIWVLRDYDKEEWELKDTLNFRFVFEEFDDRIYPKSDLQVVCIHPDCNVVFFNHALRLIAYDMDSREASVVSTFGDEKQYWSFARYVPCFLESPSLTN